MPIIVFRWIDAILPLEVLTDDVGMFDSDFPDEDWSMPVCGGYSSEDGECTRIFITSLIFSTERVHHHQ